jgi:hypothetical protein
MKGAPLFQWLVFAALWGLLLIPLGALTGESSVPPAEEAPDVSGAARARAVEAWVRVRFAHVPVRFALRRGDDLVWDETEPAARMERPLRIELANGALEWMLEVEWPDAAGLTAVECTVAPDSLPERSDVFWGCGAARGLLSFEWLEVGGHD